MPTPTLTEIGRAEAVDEMQTVSNEFRALLFSESGIAWYRRQVENCRQKVAQLLHVNLGEGGDSLVFVPNLTWVRKRR